MFANSRNAEIQHEAIRNKLIITSNGANAMGAPAVEIKIGENRA